MWFLAVFVGALVMPGFIKANWQDQKGYNWLGKIVSWLMVALVGSLIAFFFI